MGKPRRKLTFVCAHCNGQGADRQMVQRGHAFDMVPICRACLKKFRKKTRTSTPWGLLC